MGDGVAAVAPSPAERAASSLVDQLTWRVAAAGAGFALAAIAAFLAWASAGGASASPFDSGARFRLGDALGSDAIDGPVAVFIALGGLAALLAGLLGRIDSETARRWIIALGAAILALGVVEMQFVSSRPGSADIGFGLYVFALAGLLAAASPWLPATKVRN